MALKTSQLIAFLRESDSATDVKLGLNHGAFTRYRMCNASPDEFTPHIWDLSGIWKLSYCDDSEEYLRDEELLKFYPDELGEIWTVEPE